MPYLKKGFSVLNLPEGIEFRKPFTYGPKQLRQIMEAKDSISFILSKQPTEDANVPACDIHDVLDRNEALRVLSQVASLNVAKHALAGTKKVGEEDIEVVNLELQQEDRLILQGCCSTYFTEDAEAAIAHNIIHVKDCGTIVPVFNNAPSGDEPFWLFYTTSSARKVAQVKPDEAIRGYWLNLIPEVTSTNRSYEILLNHPDAIKGINLIKAGMGIVYFVTNLDLQRGTHFAMPDHFYKAIKSALHAHGLM